MLRAAPALFSTMKGGRERLRHPLRHDTGHNVRSGRRASARGRRVPQGGRAGRCGDKDLLPAARHNFLRDVAPAARLVRMVNLVVAHPSIPASTLAEFIAPVIAKSGIKGSL